MGRDQGRQQKAQDMPVLTPIVEWFTERLDALVVKGARKFLGELV